MYYQNKKHIVEALRITNDLLSLEGEADRLGDHRCAGILWGMLWDCAYKIRSHAVNEEYKAKISFIRSYTMLLIFATAVFSMTFTYPVNATTIILSTDDTETQGGLTFDREDLVEYNPTTDTSTLYLDGDLFQGTADIDAAHVLDSGNIIISTFANATLGGLAFNPGDLVEYNPTTDTATLYFEQDLFSQVENIDSVYILESGNIILSTIGSATLGGLSFEAGDLVEYNPTTDTAILYFEGSLFTDTENIDAVHILDNGNIVLSTVDVATLGGLSFTSGDLVEYNPTTDIASLYFDENNFTGSANINAVYVTTVPEPAMIALLGLGSLVLVVRRCS